jgi:pimeloyl-ACP methyl ester carboxylesterase
MHARSIWLRTLAIICGGYLMTQTPTLASTQQPIRNVVLVHGAWADGSSWAKVIPLLEERGLHVVAVQNPITEAGNNPKVAALVYVAAFGPDTGETLGNTAKDFPPPQVAPEVKPIADNFLVLTPKGVIEDFAQDLTPSERRLLLATQAPTAAAVFGAPISAAAWREKPSWYVVAENDRMINPGYEQFAAKRMGAKVLALPTSHVPMLSKPKEVAAFIAEAAAEAHTSGK